MDTSSFEHIVRIQFNALMMTVIKCTVKSRNRQFVRRSKREILFCELSDTKLSERGTIDNYSCDCISFKVLNYTIQVSNEKLAVALYKLSSKERDVILLREYSCAMKSHFRKFGNQMSGSGNHLCKYTSLLA